MSQGCYSRESAVAAIRSFYQFFAGLPSLAPEYIWEPPTGGWPEINGNSLAALGKTREVISLLRHIPYINDTQIAFRTTVIDYTSETIKWYFDKSVVQGNLLPGGGGIIPEHVALLTEGGMHGSWLLLDTQKGTITDFNPTRPPERSFPPREHPEYWRAYKTLPIHDFFESWKEEYRSLAWVVMPEDEDGVLCDLEPSTNASAFLYDSCVEEIREIYRAHGWPSWLRREECRDALLNWKDTQYEKMSSNSRTRRRR